MNSCYPFVAAIGHALDIYLNDHGNLDPKAIHIHPQRWNDIVREMESSGHKWNNTLWGIPVAKDDTINTAWKFVGAPVLEHKKCMLCGIVVGKKVRGHNLDESWVCEHCYDRITHNMGIINEQWQKIVRENNERVAQAMDKNYFKAYKEMLFGDTAN